MSRFLTILFSLLGMAGAASAQTDSPFQAEKIRDAFEKMRSTPGFDTSKPLQWGFFFVASTPKALTDIRNKLESQGYFLVEEHKDENGKFWLQLARVEVHTPQSLHKKNQELFGFAKGFKGATYDGWDVSRQSK